MECNTAHTQCTIGLARRPCQELTGWTELCQSHYDNEYNTYAHEVVWKKIGGVWGRSLGGGSTCAETVLGHNRRHRKSIMDVIVPFIPDSVIALAELYAFRQHLCSGSIDKGLDWVGYNLFYSNLTCKPPKETWKYCGEGAYQHACSWYETLGHSVSNVVSTVAQEAGHIIGEGVSVVEGWIANLFMMLWPYLLAAVGVIIVVIICKPKPLQSLIIMTTNSTTISEPVQVSTVEFYALLWMPGVNHYCSTQTSVTTKSITCQTSAGDDEEQHQPVSLEEPVSQTSPTGGSMREETGPPQLSDGLLAEVMSMIPPQPLRPYPHSSRLSIAQLTPPHMIGKGEPLLMGLHHHLSSGRSLCHLPF
ncbi:hypothetical protein XENOCAPTIV_018823 [Xenoophorus captivus]|uniref:Uncharacterized protein n=1 Tax=Xenoophorus captivus TaxID=1517983 RepID=A0ABV0R9J4_9TELE